MVLGSVLTMSMLPIRHGKKLLADIAKNCYHLFMSTNHIDQVKASLESTKGEWPSVCRDTGIGYSWLTKFAQGKIPKPGYKQIETLRVYLQKRRPQKGAA